MANPLLKFNHVLHSEKFPKEWSEGYICPIYKKKGDKTDPANHRGITISSCIGNVFTKIMNDRFMNFLEINKIITIKQIGFSPGKRTSNHVFVLKTLFDLAKQKQKTIIFMLCRPQVGI